MGKKDKKQSDSKAIAKANKKQKSLKSADKKRNKKSSNDDDEVEEDLEEILNKFQQELKNNLIVTEEVLPNGPSRRVNGTLTPDPSGNYLWLIGGDYFDGQKLHTYNDVIRYDPSKPANEAWRIYKSKNAPAPRSAHQVVSTSQGGGKLWLFGGEFAGHSTFYHFGDFWCFDVTSKEWDKIDTKIKPSPRSGHRMTVFKHLIILFGGFHDTGVRTTYLDDLWVFDTLDFKWRKIEFSPIDRKPSPRSGFSFLTCQDQSEVIVHGGFCKTYEKGKRPVAKALDDTYALKIDIENNSFKWDRRKKVGYVPSLRSGSTMCYWGNKNMGVLFGGVTDDDKDEETLQSVFHNDLFGYNLSGGGKWISLNLKKPKKALSKKSKGKGKKKKQQRNQIDSEEEDENNNNEEEDVNNYGSEDDNDQRNDNNTSNENENENENEDIDDPLKSTPLPRYNPMLAILRNTLYIFGGIFEQGTQEFTLDDMHSLALDKLDRFKCIRECVVEGIDDDQDEDDENDENDEEEENETVENEEEDENVIKEMDKVKIDDENEQRQQNEDDENSNIKSQAKAYVGVNNSNTPEAIAEREKLSKCTPQPSETLRMFFDRTRDYWTQAAFDLSIQNPDDKRRGKELRRDGFQLAEEKYEEYKPILNEIEEMIRQSGAIPTASKPSTNGSRNRR